MWAIPGVQELAATLPAGQPDWTSGPDKYISSFRAVAGAVRDTMAEHLVESFLDVRFFSSSVAVLGTTPRAGIDENELTVISV